MSAVLQWGEQHDVAYGRSFALALVVHALLIAVIVLGVRIQSSTPDTVMVELWEPPPPPMPKVEPEPPAPVPPKVEPEPPKPEPKIEKPEIVEKAAPKPKPKPKAEAKPAPKPVPKRDLEFERRMREQLAQETRALQERQAKDQAAREQVAARDRAMASWFGKIRGKIRSNIPTQAVEQVTGNPEALFEVTLLPTGEVLTVKMLKSSGNKVYDEAVERAILRSSPLPKPDQPNIFERQLKLSFRPQDK